MSQRLGAAVLVVAALDVGARAQACDGWVPLVEPGPRAWHAMAYDADRRVTVLFGGFDKDTQADANDTWEWDGAWWTRRQAAGASGVDRPYAQRGHALGFDPAGHRVLVAGENTAQDTWAWDGTVWTRLVAAGSVYGHGAWMAFNPMDGRLYFVSATARRTLMTAPARGHLAGASRSRTCSTSSPATRPAANAAGRRPRRRGGG